MVEHRLYTPGVTGSSPVPPTIFGLSGEVLIACCSIQHCPWRRRLSMSAYSVESNQNLVAFSYLSGVVDGMRYSLKERVTIRYQHAGS